MSSSQSLQIKKISQFKLPPQIQKYSFSEQMFSSLQKLINYDQGILNILTNNELKDLLQRELRRFQNTKTNDNIQVNILLDNQLSIMVMMNQVRVLMQLSISNDENVKKLAMARKRRSSDLEQSRENLMVRRYEGIASQIQKYQDEINKFMEAQVVNKDINLVSAYSFFRRVTKKLKKSSSEKLICSYAYLLNAVTYLLGEVLKKYSPQLQPSHEDDQLELQESGAQFGDLSYQHINKWKRMASRIIQQKLVELSAICQQIPQLETFNRNLQFSQLENRQKIIILKIVDVIISLHHRVSYLSRNKPQLLRELQYVQQQIQILNNTCSIFLQHLQMHSSHLRPIKFQGQVRKNSLSQGFLLMRKHLMKMSQMIVNGEQYHNSNLKRMTQFILLFVRAFTGHNDSSEQWQALVQQLSNSTESEYSQQEYEVIIQLQQCMIEYHNKIAYMQQIDQQSNTKTNEELQEEVNKLISDFQRLKAENKQHLQNLDLLTKLREDLQMEIEERDNMIYNLSTIKVTLEKKIINQQGASHHSSRAVEEQLKKQEHQTQKYLQSSLLLRQQLKVSQNQRQKLLQLLQRQKEKNMKLFESTNKCKADKERLQLENEQLYERIQKNKNDLLRHSNKLNKQINDITNEKDLLEMEVKTAEANNAKLMQRLQINERKLLEYSKLPLQQQKQHKYERQSKSQAEIQRLQGEIERYRKQVERLRKDVQNRRVEMQMVQRQSSNYKQENYVMKNKMKEIRLSQEESQEKDETIKELKAKIEKLNGKINALAKENEEAREEEEQTANKYKYSAKRVKQLQAKLTQLEVNNNQFIIELQMKNSQNIDLQKQLASQSNQYSTQLKFYKDLSIKQSQDLQTRDDRVQNLQRKIQKLQQQLSQKQQRNQQSNKQLVDMKMKQFQSTIQTHRLIEIKLEEQARTLKTQLQEKIQVEIKLNFEIDKLSKQIEKLKELLQRYMRDITEKEFIIKKEREKYEEQVKIIRDYEVKEKVYQQSQTPMRNDGKRNRQEDTIDDRQNSNNKKRTSQEHENNLDGSLSRSNVKYDMFYNAKEYQRLLKEYTDYKALMTVRVQEFQRCVNEAIKSKIDLQIKFNNAQLQIKKIINSKVINNGIANPNTAGTINSNQSSSDTAYVVKYQLRIKELTQGISGLEQKIRKLQEENTLLYNRIKKHKEVSELKIAQLQDIISNISKPNQQQIDLLKKEKHRIQQQLAQANKFFNNNKKEQNTFNQAQQLKRTVQSLNDQLSKLLHQKSRQQANSVLILKQRDQMRRQYQQMRRHLTEETKRATTLLGQNQRYKEEIRTKQTIIIENTNIKKIIQQYQSQIQTQRQLLRTQREKNKQQAGNINIQFYLQKIRTLELALAAVGDQLTDAKQALSKYKNQSQQKQTNNKQLQIMLQDNKKLFNENQYLNQTSLQLKIQIQTCIRNESQWKSREAVYLKDLQILSRQNIFLRDSMGKSEKQIKTNLPTNINLINTNYHELDQPEATQSIDGLIRQMDVVIEGKMRWEGNRLIESLQRWRVPLIIHKETEDLLNFLTQAVELIKLVRSQYISLRSLASNNLLFTNLLEFVFRILAYFSEIQTSSPQAKKIKNEIEQISKKYSGGVFFTVVQEFTIHILQNNAIEEYKRELKDKAKELLEIKERLDELITRQIEQQQKILSKPKTHRSRDTTPYRQPHSASPKQ